MQAAKSVTAGWARVLSRTQLPPLASLLHSQQQLLRPPCSRCVQTKAKSQGDKRATDSKQRQTTAAADSPTNVIRSHYEVLGVTPDSTATEIRQAFFQKVRTCHPDVASDPKSTREFLLVKDAYTILGNPEKRLDYDAAFVGGKFKDRLTSERESKEEEAKALERIKEDLDFRMKTRKSANPNRVWTFWDERRSRGWFGSIRDVTMVIKRHPDYNHKPQPPATGYALKLEQFIEKMRKNDESIKSEKVTADNMAVIGAIVALIMIAAGYSSMKPLFGENRLSHIPNDAE